MKRNPGRLLIDTANGSTKSTTSQPSWSSTDDQSQKVKKEKQSSKSGR